MQIGAFPIYSAFHMPMSTGVTVVVVSYIHFTCIYQFAWCEIKPNFKSKNFCFVVFRESKGSVCFNKLGFA